jgi:excisionase family DNA binding protein
MEQEFYSIKELAVVFAVHHTTIRRAIKKGFIIAVRVGDGKKSPYRISKKSIEAIHVALLKELSLKVNSVL